MPRALVAFCVASFLFLAAPIGQAAAPVVAIVTPPESDAFLTETITRAEAELRMAGFQTTLIAAAPGAALGELPATASPAPIATFAIVRSANGSAAIDVWVVDRLTQKTSIRRIDVGAAERVIAPSALAIRAVELLRSSFLETAIDPAEKKLAPPEVARWVDQSTLSRSEPLLRGTNAELGIGLVHSFRGIGPAVAPFLRLSHGLGSAFSLRIAVAAPAFGPGVQASSGTAQVRQELAQVEVAYVANLVGSRFLPVFFLGGGGYHLYVNGTGTGANVGQTDHVWSGLLSAGTGVAIRFGAIAWMTDGALVVTLPGASVDLAGARAGVAGRPSFLVSSGLCFTL